MLKRLIVGAFVFLAIAETTVAQYSDWRHSGTLFLDTTPEGANLPATASVEGFPLLVRLHADWFNFSQAKANGDDIRFATAAGAPLFYQIEQWDASAGTASIWVRIPVIKGNERQEIKLFWGKADAVSESNGGAVFNAGNGYASVLHLDGALNDELGTIAPTDAGTTSATGIIGAGRRFEAGKGIGCGAHVTHYPFGDNPFTSEAWFRAETTGGHIVYFGRYATRLNGNTGDGNEVAISIGSPPSLGWRSDGPAGAIAGTDAAPTLGEWTHVAATYEDGTSRIYVNGELAGSRYRKAAMSMVKDICMNIGGWRGGNYRFVGEIDEVRVSRVARTADWMKLQYENQNPMQSLVGPLVSRSTDFAVSRAAIDLLEGEATAVTAKAGGAQKLYWILKIDDEESVVAVDRFSFTLPAGSPKTRR